MGLCLAICWTFASWDVVFPLFPLIHCLTACIGYRDVQLEPTVDMLEDFVQQEDVEFYRIKGCLSLEGDNRKLEVQGAVCFT